MSVETDRAATSCSSRKSPEIYDNTVIIKGAVREAGTGEVARLLREAGDVDPVGACRRHEGHARAAIIRELRRRED